MASVIQICSLFTVALIFFTRNSVEAAPLKNNLPDDIDIRLNKFVSMHDDDNEQSKRGLDMEGILIGRREFPTDGILLGKRNYPIEGIMLGKREFPTDGVLIGKRNYPIEGIMLGKREFPTDGVLLGRREYPTEGVLLGRRNSPYFIAQNLLKQQQQQQHQ